MNLRVDKLKKVMIIECLIFILWNVVAFLFTDYDFAGFYFWGAVGFNLVAFCITVCSTLMMRTNGNRNTTEVSTIPLYFTVIYFLVTLVVNTCFAYAADGTNNAALVVINVILIIVFIVARMFTSDIFDRVKEQTDYVQAKTFPIASISARLASVLGSAENPEVKGQLYKLKEKLDYSNNMTQSFSKDKEDLFLLQIEQIESMIENNADTTEILSKIKEADKTWSQRNSLTTTMK